VAGVVDAGDCVEPFPAAFFFLFFTFLAEVLADGVATGGGEEAAGTAGVVAGVVVGVFAERVGGVVTLELDVPPNGAPPPSVKPPALPNCGGVIETTAPNPPIVPPTIKRKRLPIMS
jgi:hypothetical protein